jgi:ABC-type Fe3+-hydroxamate transport system substrate-binding protein
MMKRIMSIILVLMLIVSSMVACGTANEEAADTSSAPAAADAQKVTKSDGSPVEIAWIGKTLNNLGS